MPIDDWQFWVVTLAAVGGLALIARPLLPRRGGRAGCGSCPSQGGRADPKTTKKTTLTIEGRRVG